MDNPFADLVPKKTEPDNPFADLVPEPEESPFADITPRPSEKAALDLLLEMDYAEKVPGGKITEGGDPWRVWPSTKVGGKLIKTSAVSNLAGLMAILTKAMSTHQEEDTLAEALAMRDIGPIRERHLPNIESIQSLRKTAARFEREYDQAVRELNPNKVEESWISAVNSLAIMAPTLPLSYFLGPAAGAGAFFLSELGRVYDEDRRMGISEDKSLAHAIINAGIEGGGEFISMGKWVKIFDKIDGPIKKRIFGWMGTELATELGQESGQALSDQWFGLRDSMSLEEWGDLWLTTAISTAMVGGIVGPISGAASKLQQLHREKKANKFIDNTVKDIRTAFNEMDEQREAGLLSPMDYEESLKSINRGMKIVQSWVGQHPELSQMFSAVEERLEGMPDLSKTVEGMAEEVTAKTVEGSAETIAKQITESTVRAMTNTDDITSAVKHYRKDDLVKAAKSLGLPTSGTKRDIGLRIQKHQLALEEAPTTEKEPTPATPQKTTVKRSKDFQTEGTYDVVLPDGRETQIYRDTEQFGYGVWYEVNPDGQDVWLGNTKKEAIERLEKRQQEQAEEDEMTRELPDTWEMTKYRDDGQVKLMEVLGDVKNVTNFAKTTTLKDRNNQPINVFVIERNVGNRKKYDYLIRHTDGRLLGGSGIDGKFKSFYAARDFGKGEARKVAKQDPMTWQSKMNLRVPIPWLERMHRIQVAKNPTTSELKTMVADAEEGLRWFRDNFGSYYFWDSADGLHLDVIAELQRLDKNLRAPFGGWAEATEDIITKQDIAKGRLRGYDPELMEALEGARQWLTITPEGIGVPSSERLRWSRDKDRQKEMSFRITLEAVPSPKTATGQAISGMPFDLQLAFTREVNEVAPIKSIAADLGIEVIVTEQTGGYHGMVAPNNVVQVGTAEEATKLARALALTRTQEAVPWFHVAEKEPATGDLAVFIEFDETLTLDQRMDLSAMLATIGKDISFTELGDNRFAVINFSGIENFEDQVFDAVALVRGMGRTNDFDLIPFNPDESFYEEYDWSESGTEKALIRLAGFTPAQASKLRGWRKAAQSVADHFISEKENLTWDSVRAGERLSQPVVGPDGTIELHHWSGNDSLTVIDPVFEGTGIRAAEQERARAFPEFWVQRSNYGVNVGLPGGYVKEYSLGRHHYVTKIKADRLYDIAGDPDNLKPVAEKMIGPGGHDMAFFNAYEMAIRDAGYDGFWLNNGGLKGIVASVFKPMEAKIYDAPNGIWGSQSNPLRNPETGERVDTYREWPALWKITERERDFTDTFDIVPLDNEGRQRITEILQGFPAALVTQVEGFGYLENHKDEACDGNFGEQDKVILLKRDVLLSPDGVRVLTHELGHCLSMWYKGNAGIGGAASLSPLYKFDPMVFDPGSHIDEVGRAWDRGRQVIIEIMQRTGMGFAPGASGSELIDKLVEAVRDDTVRETFGDPDDLSQPVPKALTITGMLSKAREFGYSEKDIASIQFSMLVEYPLGALDDVMHGYQMAAYMTGHVGSPSTHTLDVLVKGMTGLPRQYIIEEVFAQMHALYNINPYMMQLLVPKNYETFNEIYRLVERATTLGEANAAVFKALRSSRPADGPAGISPRDRLSEPESGSGAEWRSQRRPPSARIQGVEARQRGDRSGNVTRRDRVWQKMLDWFGWMTPGATFAYRPATKIYLDSYHQKITDKEAKLSKKASAAAGGIKAVAKDIYKGYSSPLKEEEKYAERRGLAQGEVGASGRLINKIVEVFDGISKDMNDQAWTYYTTPDVKVEDVVTKPPEWSDKQFYQWSRRVARIKRILEQTGQELVNMDLLDQEIYDQHKGSYLPRMYLQYVLGDEGMQMLSNHGRLDLNYLRTRKDIPKYLREIFLGEIKDPGFLLAMAVGRAHRDMAIHRFLQDISENRNWVAPATLINIPIGEYYDHDDPNGTYAKGDEIYVEATPQWAKHEGERMLSMIDKYHPLTRAKAAAVASVMIAAADRQLQSEKQEFDLKTYEMIPDSKRYGHLRGAWVRKEIAWDIKGAFTAAPDTDYMNWYMNHSKKLMGYWKVNKVALNPPTIARNIMSNMILLNLSGMPLFRPSKHNVAWMMFHDAISDIRHNGKYYREFIKRGGKESTFSSAELSKITNEFQKYYKGAGKTAMYAMAKAVDAIYETAGNVYQFTEMVGKIAKMKYEVEVNGLTMGEAMNEANKWLFDYSFVPRGVEFLRSEMVIGIPFLTFYYKVTARIAETAIKHPQRFLPYVGLSYGLQPLIAAMMPDFDDDDIEQARTQLPYFIRERMGLLPMPFRDANGNIQFLDMSYIFPWTMPVETLKAAGTLDAAKLLSTVGMGGSPLVSSMTGLLSNRHPFYGTDIWKEKKMKDAGFKSYDKSEEITSRIGYLWNVWTPGLLTTTPSNPIVKTAQAIRNAPSAYLRTPPTVPQAALRFIGVNVYPTNREALINNARIMQMYINQYAAEMRSEANKDLSKQQETIEKYMPRLLEFQEELIDYLQRMNIDESELEE